MLKIDSGENTANCPNLRILITYQSHLVFDYVKNNNESVYLSNMNIGTGLIYLKVSRVLH